MPELRIDPIIGRRAYVAEDRAGRPNDYARGAEAPSPRESCCFCAGHEGLTPAAAAEVVDAHGHWQVRVVPNKYPAVTLAAPPERAFGVHEVVIESPTHHLDVTALGAGGLATVLAVFRDRLRHWARDGRLRHAVVFKNSGDAAGASLEHVHSQLVALPYVAAAVQAELDAAARFQAAHGRCVFCDLVEREQAAGERVVICDGGYLAVCAVAPRQPFETWILPERHAARFETTGDPQLERLAGVLHSVLKRLEAASPGAAYNLLLHTGPFDAADEAFHWHWELVPRLTHEAGLEWGGGVYITPLSPEHAAAQLRAQ